MTSPSCTATSSNVRRSSSTIAFSAPGWSSGTNRARVPSALNGSRKPSLWVSWTLPISLPWNPPSSARNTGGEASAAALCAATAASSSSTSRPVARAAATWASISAPSAPSRMTRSSSAYLAAASIASAPLLAKTQE